MRGEVHILVHCPIDTLQWGSTHSAVTDLVRYVCDNEHYIGRDFLVLQGITKISMRFLLQMPSFGH